MGVFINRPGRHWVTLFDMAGRKLREIRSAKWPVDYDLASDLEAAGTGVYLLRVSLPGAMVRCKRYFVDR